MTRLIYTLISLLIVQNAYSQARPLEIWSDGTKLNAYFYQAPGDQIKPTVIWCHGNPGSREEGKSQFAAQLNDQGLHVLRFNYRGLWGSEGTYTPGNCHRDLKHVLDYILKADQSSDLNIDTNRVIVAGYSHGSNITIVSALHDQRIKEIICLGLADFSYLIKEYFNPFNPQMKVFSQVTKDAIWGDANDGQGTYARDYDKYVFDVLFNNYKYNYVENAAKLIDKRIYIIVGMNDVTVPIEHHFMPLYRKLKEINHPDFEYEITDSDHGFQELYEKPLAQMISTWIFK